MHAIAPDKEITWEQRHMGIESSPLLAPLPASQGQEERSPLAVKLTGVRFFRALPSVQHPPALLVIGELAGWVKEFCGKEERFERQQGHALCSRVRCRHPLQRIGLERERGEREWQRMVL